MDLQVRDSTGFVLSKEDKFEFVKAMLNEKPELGNPERNRFKVI